MAPEKDKTDREKMRDKRYEEILDQEALMAWTTLDSFHHERGPAWYLVAAIAGLLVIIYAIFTQAWTLAVVVSLLAGVIYLFAQEPAEEVEIVVTRLGIHVSNRFYPYSGLSSFWIVSEPEYRSLYIQLVGRVPRIIHLRLETQNPVRLREILLAQVPEARERGERFIDVLERRLKLL